MVVLFGYSKSVAGEIRVHCTQCQMWAHKNAQVAFPGNRLIFAPPPSLMLQMKIFEVLWTYSILSFVCQCNL